MGEICSSELLVEIIRVMAQTYAASVLQDAGHSVDDTSVNMLADMMLRTAQSLAWPPAQPALHHDGLVQLSEAWPCPPESAPPAPWIQGPVWAAPRIGPAPEWKATPATETRWSQMDNVEPPTSRVPAHRPRQPALSRSRSRSRDRKSRCRAPFRRALSPRSIPRASIPDAPSKPSNPDSPFKQITS
jgi:hypothetical protein